MQDTNEMNVRGVKDLIFCGWNVDEVTNLVRREGGFWLI